MEDHEVFDWNNTKNAAYFLTVINTVGIHTVGIHNNLTIIITHNRPVIHTCFTYPNLNMDDFSILAGPLWHDLYGCLEWQSTYMIQLCNWWS